MMKAVGRWNGRTTKFSATRRPTTAGSEAAGQSVRISGTAGRSISLAAICAAISPWVEFFSRGIAR